jgi:hypothetical protein
MRNDWGTIHHILQQDLGKREIWTKCVPDNFTDKLTLTR